MSNAAVAEKVTHTIDIDVNPGDHINPGGMSSGDTSHQSEAEKTALRKKFNAVKRAVVECCGQDGQLVTFEQKIHELFD